jgi:hypothetical protein
MKTEIEINLTPEQLAASFIHWSSDEQANFINLIGKQFKLCDFSAEEQCCWLANDINKDGKDFIFTVANFLKCIGLPSSSPKIDTLINSYDTDGL